MDGRPVLVVGGGAVASRKIRMLIRCGADVHVVSPIVCPAVRRWANSGMLVWHPDTFRGIKIGRRVPVMVFACTDSTSVNAKVSREAGSKRVWVNVSDDPKGSSFHVPSVIRKGGWTLTVSSAGRAPVLVKYLRGKIEQMLGPWMVAALTIFTQARTWLKLHVPDISARRRILSHMVESGIVEEILRHARGQRRTFMILWLKKQIPCRLPESSRRKRGLHSQSRRRRKYRPDSCL